jgi:hypothetical protein
MSSVVSEITTIIGWSVGILLLAVVLPIALDKRFPQHKGER